MNIVWKMDSETHRIVTEHVVTFTNMFFFVFNGAADRKKEAYRINDNFLKTNKVNKLSLLVQL